jgi:hypothetical protein
MADQPDPWEEELTSGDAARFLEDHWLGTECAELRQSRVAWGDGDPEDRDRAALVSKARRALRVGARQIAEGKPNAAFLDYLAHGIMRFLDGSEKTLDQAFRVALKRGRPALDPAVFDPVIDTYLRAIRRLRGADESVRERIALKWAFKTHHDKTPEQFRSRNRGADVDDGWIYDRMTETKRVLQSRGYYFAESNRPI